MLQYYKVKHQPLGVKYEDEGDEPRDTDYTRAAGAEFVFDCVKADAL